MSKKLLLFGGNIEPACQYCEHGCAAGKPSVILCLEKGEVAPYFSCKHFLYAPLKRIPRRAAPLPQYSKDDFTL